MACEDVILASAPDSFWVALDRRCVSQTIRLPSTGREEFYEDPQGMHYAEARYLCYYLQEKHLLRKFYHQFKKNHSADPTGIKTLLRVTGKDSLEQLQAEWLEFLAPLSYRR